MKKYLICQNEKSNKFWSIETYGNNFTVIYGKVGSKGVSQTKEFSSEELCNKEAEKLIREKLKKGYLEVFNEKKTKPDEIKVTSSDNVSPIRKFFNEYGKFIKPINIGGDYNISFDHELEVGKDSCFCTFGVLPLMSVGGTGHLHIVLIPALHKPLNEWNVAFFDEEKGTGVTFSSSITKWLPSYLIFERERISEDLEKNRAKIIKFGKIFSPNIETLVDKIIHKNYNVVSELYFLSEPNSFLHQFFQIIEKDKQIALAEMTNFYKKHPFFNAPLNFFAKHSHFSEEIVNSLLFANLRFDLPDFSHCNIANWWMSQPHNDEHPLFPLLKKAADYSYVSDGGNSYLKAGKKFEEEGKISEAISCFENSIYQEKVENEEFNEESYEKILSLAPQLKDPIYSTFVKKC